MPRKTPAPVDQELHPAAGADMTSPAVQQERSPGHQPGKSAPPASTRRLSVRLAAERAGTSTRTLKRWIAAGRLRAIRLPSLGGRGHLRQIRTDAGQERQITNSTTGHTLADRTGQQFNNSSISDETPNSVSTISLAALAYAADCTADK